MGHVTAKEYLNLQKRLDDGVQGAPAAESLYKILELLFTEEEARLASVLPLKMFSVKEAAKRWEKDEREAENILDGLADKAILIDSEKDGKKLYCLAPTMAGFFEFSIMRTDGKFDRKLLSELFYQYINTEENFVREVLGIKPASARVFVHETAIKEEDQKIILDYERASHIIKSATCIGVGTCYCRHKMEHAGRACAMPQEVCLTFNGCAESLVRHGVAKKISLAEALNILDETIALGLVQIGDNIQTGVNFICNCCGCCCEAIIACKKLGCYDDFRSNFYAVNKQAECNGCGLCAKRCPFAAIEMETDGLGKKFARIDSAKCVGCGVCTRFCPTKSLTLMRHDELADTPHSTIERVVLEAINNNKLQNYIFDNYTLWTNRYLRRVLGAILSLPTAKRILASKQLRSIFFDNINKKKTAAGYNKIYQEGKNNANKKPRSKE
ncbi:MAG: 4Fe-4S dicluster domain-containing protein [Patescibacteria group bacterium]|jgi:ferredoxin